MEASKQTIQQIERTLRKVIAKFPTEAEPVMTDIHLLVSNYTGEIRTYNDDDEELDRCIIEEWIKNSDEDFYEDIAPLLRSCIEIPVQCTLKLVKEVRQCKLTCRKLFFEVCVLGYQCVNVLTSLCV